MDNLSPVDRRRAMQAVRVRNTKPELLVRKRAHAIGLRFRLHRRDLLGTPDLVFPRRRTVVFVHGCFWHGRSDCPRGRLPQTNGEFWSAKIERNKARDSAAIELLQRASWSVVVIWECETRSVEKIDNCLSPLLLGS
ncbi:very short patch repair endonuclease [Sphingomonas sp. ST-64]|uniref:Very short patch repair endonuclease n=1 Tax=Sphingomonas plantiphila TaxID=3163295 RepID=A0ABW8YJT0_9SPHN